MQRFDCSYERVATATHLFACICLVSLLFACSDQKQPYDPITCCGIYNRVPVVEQMDQTTEDWTAVYSTGGGHLESVVMRVRPDGYVQVGRETWFGLRSADDFPAIVRKLSSEEFDAIQNIDVAPLVSETVEVERFPTPDEGGVNLYWADAEGMMWVIRYAESTRSIFNVFENLMASIASDYASDPSGCLLSMGQMETVLLEEGAELPANMDDLAALGIEGNDPFIVIVPDTESEDGFQVRHLSPNHFGSTLGELPVILKSILGLPWQEPPANEVLVDFNEEVAQNVCGTFAGSLLSEEDLLTIFYSPLNLVNGIPGEDTPVYQAVAVLQNP